MPEACSTEELQPHTRHRGTRGDYSGSTCVRAQLPICTDAGSNQGSGSILQYDTVANCNANIPKSWNRGWGAIGSQT